MVGWIGSGEGRLASDAEGRSSCTKIGGCGTAGEARRVGCNIG